MARRRVARRVPISEKEKTVKNSTKDQVQGKIHLVKGTLKENAGRIINSPGLEVEGQLEKTAGKVQQKVGQIEEVLEK
jgi:uncharacterized protein YjbJ (UPF0337 family)